MNIGKIADDIRDKPAFYLSGCAVVCALILSVIAVVKWTGGMEKMVSLKTQELTRFNTVREEYLKFKKKAGSEVEKKIYTPQTEGSASALLQEIGKSIGIHDKISSFKPVEEKREDGYVKSGVEVKVNEINLNQLVNLLYKMIENHKNLLLIKSISIDARFDNPALLDIAMHIIFLTKKTL